MSCLWILLLGVFCLTSLYVVEAISDVQCGEEGCDLHSSITESSSRRLNPPPPTIPPKKPSPFNSVRYRQYREATPEVLSAERMLGNLSVYAAERRLIDMETEQYNRQLQVLREQNIEIVGYLHCSTWRVHWRRVLAELLYALDGQRRFTNETVARAMMASELVNFEEISRTYTYHANDTKGNYPSLLRDGKVYMTISEIEEKRAATVSMVTEVVDGLNLKHRENLVLVYRPSTLRTPNMDKTRFNDTTPSTAEIPTIEAMQRHAQEYHNNGRQAMMYYVHTKGACCMRGYYTKMVGVNDWREAMVASVVEFPSICMNAIKNYNMLSCGALKDARGTFFAGTFWWTTSTYLALRDTYYDRFNAYEAESFIATLSSNITTSLKIMRGCTHSIIPSQNAHPYFFSLPMAKYFPELWTSIFLGIPQSHRDSIINDINGTSICNKILQLKSFNKSQEIITSIADQLPNSVQDNINVRTVKSLW